MKFLVIQMKFSTAVSPFHITSRVSFLSLIDPIHPAYNINVYTKFLNRSSFVILEKKKIFKKSRSSSS